MYLVTSAEMQAMDRMAIERFGLPGRLLMENAGREAARVFRTHFGEAARRGVGVVAGRGNNGGDGCVIARYLAQKGFPVTVYLLTTAEQVRGLDRRAIEERGIAGYELMTRAAQESSNPSEKQMFLKPTAKPLPRATPSPRVVLPVPPGSRIGSRGSSSAGGGASAAHRRITSATGSVPVTT